MSIAKRHRRRCQNHHPRRPESHRPRRFQSYRPSRRRQRLRWGRLRPVHPARMPSAFLNLRCTSICSNLLFCRALRDSTMTGTGQRQCASAALLTAVYPALTVWPFGATFCAWTRSAGNHRGTTQDRIQKSRLPGGAPNQSGKMTFVSSIGIGAAPRGANPS